MPPPPAQPDPADPDYDQKAAEYNVLMAERVTEIITKDLREGAERADRAERRTAEGAARADERARRLQESARRYRALEEVGQRQDVPHTPGCPRPVLRFEQLPERPGGPWIGFVECPYCRARSGVTEGATELSAARSESEAICHGLTSKEIRDARRAHDADGPRSQAVHRRLGVSASTLRRAREGLGLLPWPENEPGSAS